MMERIYGQRGGRMEQRGRENDGENKQVKENGENRQRKRWKELIDSESKGWRK